MLQERRDDMVLRRAGGGGGGGAAGTAAGASPSLLSLRQQKLEGALPPHLALDNKDEPAGGGGGGEGEGEGEWAAGEYDGGRGASPGERGKEEGVGEEEAEEDRPTAASAVGAEAAVFVGEHEDYYFRAGTLRRRSSMHARIADRGA